MFELGIVNEPSVFELLRFDCICNLVSNFFHIYISIFKLILQMKLSAKDNM